MKNYIRYSALITAIVVTILSLVSLIEPATVMGVELKEANIYSSVVSGSDIRVALGLETKIDKKTEEIDSSEVYETSTETDKLTSTDKTAKREAQTYRKQLNPNDLVAIEDFSEQGDILKRVANSFAQASQRNVRIAFMGDSFIEGDILTMNVRQKLQTKYGGSGVGFMPITSPTAKFRITIQHNYSTDWRTRSIVKEHKSNNYLLSGFVFEPKDGSWVEYKAAQSGAKSLQEFQKVTLVLKNQQNSTIEVQLNNELHKNYNLVPSDELQFIEIETQGAKQIKFTFNEVDGLVVYGVLFDGHKGISVDNYAVRGNIGITMYAINESLSKQYNEVAPYDLIVMEYGLNMIDEQNTEGYDFYGTQIKRVVEHIKSCYENTPIVIMGVSDRAGLDKGDYKTLNAVYAMDKTLRDAAKKGKVGYWSTFDAMSCYGGIVGFVERGWAAKDYTHINSRGGEKLAAKLVEAL